MKCRFSAQTSNKHSMLTLVVRWPFLRIYRYTTQKLFPHACNVITRLRCMTGDARPTSKYRYRSAPISRSTELGRRRSMAGIKTNVHVKRRAFLPFRDAITPATQPRYTAAHRAMQEIAMRWRLRRSRDDCHGSGRPTRQRYNGFTSRSDFHGTERQAI